LKNVEHCDPFGQELVDHLDPRHVF
jgi:hypothetical protein